MGTAGIVHQRVPSATQVSRSFPLCVRPVPSMVRASNVPRGFFLTSDAGASAHIFPHQLRRSEADASRNPPARGILQCLFCSDPSMHVISRKALRRFWDKHPDSEGAFVRWFIIMEQNDFESFDALRTTFPSADKVGESIVFNIAGNRYPLIASVHFNRRKVYVRHVLTHHEYDRGDWKQ
jgi:mRNA interferase HigB